MPSAIACHQAKSTTDFFQKTNHKKRFGLKSDACFANTLLKVTRGTF